MGVHGLKRWLDRRYPNTVCSVVEDSVSADTSQPNPNGVEFDNLYIDMNEIIHTCFHPDRMPNPRLYDEVFDPIFMVIDRVFSIVRPRKLLFLSVDGVAPRAKLNQQRKRRFKAAKSFSKKTPLDSNVITPGTEFMDLLSRALKYFVYVKVNMDPGWRGIKVILSDSSVVGEGEHKIMSFIRSQRNLPGYDSNTRHCLYGLASDLIMLALATHEIHISILRELEVLIYPCGLAYSDSMRRLLEGLKFEFFNIWVLREYLESELLSNVEVTDFERVIDDFVFMCYLAGNDFLPSLPSLDASKDGFEMLLSVYRHEFIKMGYLINAPEVNLNSLEHFLQVLGSQEDAVFGRWNKNLMKKNRGKTKNKRECSVILHDKQNYYTGNFDCKSVDVYRVKKHAVLKYVEGMCWIMRLYYHQVPSWQWFYPYRHAPLASDFCDLDKLEINFTLGQPFKPLDQLLAVLPARRNLMTMPNSPILDFYPDSAKVNMHGVKKAAKRQTVTVATLPFIDESRLLSAIAKVEHTLTDEEKQRNRFGRDMLFVHSRHPLARMIEDIPLSDSSSEVQIQIRSDCSDGMNGHLCISDRPVLPSTIPSPFGNKPTLELNQVKSVDYKCPSHAHVPKLLCGVMMPPRILRSKDRPHPPVIFYKQTACPTEKQQKKKPGAEPQAGLVNCGAEVEGHEAKVEVPGGITNTVNSVEEPAIGTGTSSTQQEQTVPLKCKKMKHTEDKKIVINGLGENKMESRADAEAVANVGENLKTKIDSVGGHRNGNEEKNLDAQQQLGFVDQGAEAKGHEADGEVPQELKDMVHSVEPTIVTGSSNTQEEQTVPPKRKKRRRPEEKMALIKGVGENKMESEVDAEVVANVGENLINKLDGIGGQRKETEEKKLDAQRQLSLGDTGAEAKGHEQVVNTVEETAIGTGSTNTQQEQPVPLKRKKRRHDIIGETDAEVVAKEEVGGENLTNKTDNVGGERKGTLEKTAKRKLVNETDVLVEPTIGAGSLNTQQEKPVPLRRKKRKHNKDTVNSVEATIGTASSNTQEEQPVPPKRKKRRHTEDKTALINGAGENKTKSQADAAAVANVAKNLTNNLDGIGDQCTGTEEKILDTQQQLGLVDPGAEAKGHRPEGEVPQELEDMVISTGEPTIGTASSNTPQGHPVPLKRKKRKHTKDTTDVINGGGENKMESQVDVEGMANFGENLTNKMDSVGLQRKGTEKEELDARQQQGLGESGAVAKGHEHDGKVPRELKDVVNSVEVPAIEMGSSIIQQEQPVPLKRKKRRNTINGDAGENKVESLTLAVADKDAEVMAKEEVGGENLTNKMDNVGGERKGTVENTAEPKLVEEADVLVELTIGKGAPNTQEEQPVPLKRKKRRDTKDKMAVIKAVATEEVSGENLTNKMDNVGGERKGAVEKTTEPKLVEEADVLVEPTIRTGAPNTQEEQPVPLKRKKRRETKDTMAVIKAVGKEEVGGENLTNKMDNVGGERKGTVEKMAEPKQVEEADVLVEPTIETWSPNTREERPVALKRKKRRDPKDKMAAMKVVAKEEVGGENLINKIANVGGERKGTVEKSAEPKLVEEADVLVEPTIGTWSPSTKEERPVPLKRKKRRDTKDQMAVIMVAGENEMESHADAEAVANAAKGLTNTLDGIGGQCTGTEAKNLDAQQQLGLVDPGGEAKGHGPEGEVPRELKDMVNSVEEPTIGAAPSNTQQEQPVPLKRKKRKHTKDKMAVINGGGENKTESQVDAEDVANVGDDRTNKMDSVGGQRKGTKEKKLDAGQQLGLGDPGDEAKGHKHDGKVRQRLKDMVNSVEEQVIGMGSSNTQQEQPLPLKRKKRRHTINGGAVENKVESPTPADNDAEVVAKEEVGGEKLRNNMDKVDETDVVVGHVEGKGEKKRKKVRGGEKECEISRDEETEGRSKSRKRRKKVEGEIGAENVMEQAKTKSSSKSVVED